MSWELVVVFALPALVALALWLTDARPANARRVAIAASVLLVAVSARMVAHASSGAVEVHAFGGWQPPFGVVFIADRLSSLMVLLTALLVLVTVVALRPAAHGARVVRRALPLISLLTTGLNGAFLTGDLFNLFVMFELVLLTSYLLLQVPESTRSLRAAFPNVVINVLASLLFFTSVGTLYGICGSVNLADIASRIGDAPDALRMTALTMLTVAFAVKAGLVPFGFWLPATYPVTCAPIAALFAGIMTKLGAYALLRTVPTLMVGTPLPGALVAVGATGALLAVLAALSQYELRRLLGFHSLSQMGYAVASLGLLTTSSIAAAVLFLVHHALVKSSLYLVADELERLHGTRDLRRMTPIRSTGLAALFLAAALTLAGLPPSSGFIAKLAVFRACLEVGSALVVVPLAAASIFTLASMLKIWQFGFQSTSESPAQPVEVSSRSLVPLATLVLLGGLLAVMAGPALDYSMAIAVDLLTPAVTQAGLDR